MLSDICEINPAAHTELAEDELCSFVPMESVDDFSGRIERTYVRPIREVAKGYTPFADDDVIVAKITPCMQNGKAAIARNLRNGIGFGSTEFHVLRKSDEVIPEWLYFFWRYTPTRINAEKTMRGSAGQKRVPADYLETLEIPLPDPSEQKRLAAILERADRLRRLRRYGLEMVAEILRAVFLDMFGDPQSNPRGWEKCSIDDVLEFSQYGTSQKSNSENRGVPVLGMGNVTNDGEIDSSSLAYVDLPQSEFEDLKLNSGDIIFNRTNSTELVGKTACWRFGMDAVVASYLVRLRLKPTVVPEFFVALLNSAYFKTLFRERCKRAVGQSNISPTLLKEFAMYCPPIDLQEEFGALVRKRDALRNIHREALRQAEHLFQTLLQRAFTSGL